MIGVLPNSLNVGGVEYPIHSDYRHILHIFQAFNDDEIDDYTKAIICVYCLYEQAEDIPDGHMQEAIEKAFWFCDGGDTPRSDNDDIKVIDWEQDEKIIFPAINKLMGQEVRMLPYMHWWTFIGLFNEIGEGLFATVVNIRNKRARGKKLDDGEREFYKKNKKLVNLYTEKEAKAIEETESFLKNLV